LQGSSRCCLTFLHSISESTQGYLDAAVQTAVSNLKRPRDIGSATASVSSRSSSRQSPANKKLRVSQCSESTPQAAVNSGKQIAVEQLLNAAQVTAVQRDQHGIKQTNNSSNSAALASAEAAAANTNSLQQVLAAAMSTFNAVDSASDTILPITALLVSWQDTIDEEGIHRVCLVLNDTIALLRCTSGSTGGQCTVPAGVSFASTVSVDKQQLAATTTTSAAATATPTAVLYAARATFDELDIVCEALLSMIALLTDWTHSAIDCSKERVITIMQAIIALLSWSSCATSSSDCISDQTSITDWTHSAIDCSKESVITTIQAIIALLSWSSCAAVTVSVIKLVRPWSQELSK
jgi:hypothetical protein